VAPGHRERRGNFEVPVDLNGGGEVRKGGKIERRLEFSISSRGPEGKTSVNKEKEKGRAGAGGARNAKKGGAPARGAPSTRWRARRMRDRGIGEKIFPKVSKQKASFDKRCFAIGSKRRKERIQKSRSDGGIGRKEPRGKSWEQSGGSRERRRV